jgi:NAD+ diphosphatase
MVGFRAEAVPGEVIAVDHDELTEANWYSRADLLAAIQDGLALPGPVSIARHIIEAWYGGPLPTP